MERVVSWESFGEWRPETQVKVGADKGLCLHKFVFHWPEAGRWFLETVLLLVHTSPSEGVWVCPCQVQLTVKWDKVHLWHALQPFSTPNKVPLGTGRSHSYWWCSLTFHHSSTIVNQLTLPLPSSCLASSMSSSDLVQQRL